MNDPVRVYTTPENMVSDPGPGVREIVHDPSGSSWVEYVANLYRICDFRFVPLIRKETGFTCSLDILFLRRGHPGELITQGGDIDNRIKVLFDSLKMPKDGTEVQDIPSEDEDPFFCLL